MRTVASSLTGVFLVLGLFPAVAEAKGPRGGSSHGRSPGYSSFNNSKPTWSNSNASRVPFTIPNMGNKTTTSNKSGGVTGTSSTVGKAKATTSIGSSGNLFKKKEKGNVGHVVKSDKKKHWHDKHK